MPDPAPGPCSSWSAPGSTLWRSRSATCTDSPRLPRHARFGDGYSAIAEKCPVPLVLHGAKRSAARAASRRAQLGVVKVNVNAELRRAYLGELKVHCQVMPTADAVAVWQEGRAAVTAAALRIIRSLSPIRHPYTTEHVTALGGHCAKLGTVRSKAPPAPPGSPMCPVPNPGSSPSPRRFWRGVLPSRRLWRCWMTAPCGRWRGNDGRCRPPGSRHGRVASTAATSWNCAPTRQWLRRAGHHDGLLDQRAACRNAQLSVHADNLVAVSPFRQAAGAEVGLEVDIHELVSEKLSTTCCQPRRKGTTTTAP